MSTETGPIAEGSYEWYRLEVARLNERVEYLNGRVADLQEYEVGIKHLTTEDGSINMSLALAHDQMRIFVAAFQKVLDEQGGPNYVEMNFKLAGTLDRYTVTIKRPKGKTPADVASEQRVRAEEAEAERDALKAELDRLKRERAGWRSIAGIDEIAKALGIDSALYETDDVIAIAQRTVAELAEARAAIERFQQELAQARADWQYTDPSERPRCVMCGEDHLANLFAALDAPQRPEDTREADKLTPHRDVMVAAVQDAAALLDAWGAELTALQAGAVIDAVLDAVRKAEDTREETGRDGH